MATLRKDELPQNDRVIFLVKPENLTLADWKEMEPEDRLFYMQNSYKNLRVINVPDCDRSFLEILDDSKPRKKREMP
jgi:hypothetical protein